jgi:hypothetical protein
MVKTYGLHDDLMFSNISDIDYDNDLLYILDGSLLKLKFINSNNKVTKTLSFKRGRGPGEFTFMIDKFEVFQDSLLFFVDMREIEKYSISGEYITTLKMPFQIFDIENVKDSVLLLNTVNGEKNILYYINSEGKLLDSIDVPFDKKGFHLGFPAICHVSDDKYVYLASPYETRILKMDLQGNVIWEYMDNNAQFIKKPEFNQSGKRISIYQKKGWSSLWEDAQYIYASTFNVTKKNAMKAILVLDKHFGKLKTIFHTPEYINMKSFLNRKKIYQKVLDPEKGTYLAEVTLDWR